MLTRSVSEARKQISIDSISHQRKLQCLYTLRVIFFNTNCTCSVPMHLLLTDLVEAHGGSSELIRLLNSVGAIASADTHQCYLQFQIERKHRNGILSEQDTGDEQDTRDEQETGDEQESRIQEMSRREETSRRQEMSRRAGYRR